MFAYKERYAIFTAHNCQWELYRSYATKRMAIKQMVQLAKYWPNVDMQLTREAITYIEVEVE